MNTTTFMITGALLIGLSGCATQVAGPGTATVERPPLEQTEPVARAVPATGTRIPGNEATQPTQVVSQGELDRSAGLDVQRGLRMMVPSSW